MGPFAVFNSHTYDDLLMTNTRRPNKGRHSLTSRQEVQELSDPVSSEGDMNSSPEADMDQRLPEYPSHDDPMQGDGAICTDFETYIANSSVSNSEIMDAASQAIANADGTIPDLLDLDISFEKDFSLDLPDKEMALVPLRQSPADPPFAPSPHLELQTPQFQDPQTSMLMHHYVNYVADLLQPVLHPSNPWRTVYIPYALEGCPDLLLSPNLTASSDVSIALFHSLLSAAAFHLRNVSDGCQKYHKLGLQHRTKSLRALNSALLYSSDVQLYTVYLTAMLSLVTIDVSI